MLVFVQDLVDLVEFRLDFVPVVRVCLSSSVSAWYVFHKPG